MTTTRSSRLGIAALAALLVASVIAIVSGGLFAGQAEAQDGRNAEPRTAAVRGPLQRQAPDETPPPAPVGVSDEAAEAGVEIVGLDDADYEAFEACLDGIWGDIDHDTELSEENYEALDAQVETDCLPLLPEGEQALIASFGPFEDCLDDALGDDASIEDFEAAEEACADSLPPELAEMEAAFADFDQCLADNGVDIDSTMIDGGIFEGDLFEGDLLAGDMFDGDMLDGEIFGAATNTVIVMTENGEQIIELGEGAASVTITSDGDTVTVNTDGDVSVIELDFDGDMIDFGADMIDFGDMEAHDAAFETCEPLLPAEATMGFALVESLLDA